MKIGLFADSHYSSAALTCGCRYNRKSLQKIKSAFEAFAKEKCDLVICLGDLIDHEKKHSDEILHLQEIADIIKRYAIKTVVIMGNHDAFSFTEEEFYIILGEDCKPKTLSVAGKTLLFADACYYKNGDHYRVGDDDWTNTYVPDLKSLEEKLSSSVGDCYVFMHQNVDAAIREDHRIFNDVEFREVIEKSGKVKGVYQGHYHAGNYSKLNGIKYITLPAMCERKNAYFVVEI